VQPWRGGAVALLLVRLLAAAGDLAPRLGLVRALPRRGELGDDDLVHQRDVGLDVEDVTGQFDRGGRGAPVALHVDAAHYAPPFVTLALAAVRSSTGAPFGPGIAPRTSSRFCSVS